MSPWSMVTTPNKEWKYVNASACRSIDHITILQATTVPY